MLAPLLESDTIFDFFALVKKLLFILFLLALTPGLVVAQDHKSFADIFGNIQISEFSKISNILVMEELARSNSNKKITDLKKEEYLPYINRAYESFVKNINFTKNDDGRIGFEVIFNDESVVVFFLTEKDSSQVKENYLQQSLGVQGLIKSLEVEERAYHQARIITGVFGKLPVSEVKIIHNPSN
jgi:hypothetical protein